MAHEVTAFGALGSLSRSSAYQTIRQEKKKERHSQRVIQRRKASLDNGNSYDSIIHDEEEPVGHDDGTPLEGIKEMFAENRINILLVFLPFAWWSHHAQWSDSSIFVLNFIALLPLAAMLGVFTEELATHTNDVIGGLINASFGNAVELVVAIQAMLAEEYRVAQASLIGSVFSNLLLVLGTCFFLGGCYHKEQQFVAAGAVASIALLGFSGLGLLLPAQFDDTDEIQKEDILYLSRITSVLLVIMYGCLLFFQLKTHVSLFTSDDEAVVLVPFYWALSGLIIITAIVTLFSEYLVGSIDGFCEELNIGRSFVGLIILPIVGNAVEHISAVTVAMKNKIDLALAVALGSAVQIALFVLPSVVLAGWATGKLVSLKFPMFEVMLYLVSVVLVSMCLSNSRSNWLEGILLIATYILVAVAVFYEEDLDGDVNGDLNGVK